MLCRSRIRSSFVATCASTLHEFEFAAPTRTSDRVCSRQTNCSDGQYQVTAPTATADRVCASSTPCADSQYETKAASDSSDRACADHSLCGAAQFEFHGIEFDPESVREEEYCYIPMGGALPDPEQRIVPFGGAANTVHPATGYQLCRMLCSSTDGSC